MQIQDHAVSVPRSFQWQFLIVIVMLFSMLNFMVIIFTRNQWYYYKSIQSTPLIHWVSRNGVAIIANLCENCHPSQTLNVTISILLKLFEPNVINARNTVNDNLTIVINDVFANMGIDGWRAAIITAWVGIVVLEVVPIPSSILTNRWI